MQKWSGSRQGLCRNPQAVPISILDSDVSKTVRERADLLVRWYNVAQRGYSCGTHADEEDDSDTDYDFIDENAEEERKARKRRKRRRGGTNSLRIRTWRRTSRPQHRLHLL